MSETDTSSAWKFPAFELPKFESTSLEIPAAFRDLADKNIAQAKAAYEKLKTTAEQSTELLEQTFSAASKGMADYNLKLIEAWRADANALFDLFSSLVSVKTVSDVVEISTAHARQQFEVVTAQSKDLSALAQKVASDTAEPIKTGMNKAFKLVA